MSPRGHDRKFQGPIIPVGARVVCCEERGWWKADVREIGTVLTVETVAGTSRRARRFGMQLPIYSVKLDRGRTVSITGNTRIQKIEPQTSAEAMK